jgi:RNase P/RNase MRP subunit POP5
MATRPRNRFVLLDVECEKITSIQAGHLLGAIRNLLADLWGELAQAICAPLLKLAFLEPLSSTRGLAILKYPRDFQVQVISTCSLLWSLNSSVSLCLRTLQITGKLKNAAKFGILITQSWKGNPAVIQKLKELPDFI